MAEWFHNCKSAGRGLLTPYGEQCDKCGMDSPEGAEPRSFDERWNVAWTKECEAKGITPRIDGFPAPAAARRIRELKHPTDGVTEARHQAISPPHAVDSQKGQA